MQPLCNAILIAYIENVKRLIFSLSHPKKSLLFIGHPRSMVLALESDSTSSNLSNSILASYEDGPFHVPFSSYLSFVWYHR